MKEEWVTDKWWVSPHLYANEVQSKMSLPKPEEIVISDCTLRDGEQMAGVVLRASEKLAIAKKLDELGIPEIEAGMPVISDEEKRAVKGIAKAGLSAKITCLSRSRKSDIDVALECDVWGVRVSLPTGYPYRKYIIDKSEEEIIGMGIDALEYAKAHGLYVIFSASDFSRAKMDYLKKVVSTLIREAHIDQVRLPDTVGCITPWAMRYVVREVKKVAGNVPIEVHPHDDFGLATANAVAAISEGAVCLSTTINGIGERSGNAATEEVVLALLILYGIDLGIRCEKFYEVSKLVQELTGVRVQRHKAVVGDNIFSHDSGETIVGLLRNPFASSPYLPELVGQSRNIFIGKKSGRHAIIWKLRQLGLSANEEQVIEILRRTKSLGEQEKSPVSDEDFLAIVKQVKGQV